MKRLVRAALALVCISGLAGCTWLRPVPRDGVNGIDMAIIAACAERGACR